MKTIKWHVFSACLTFMLFASFFASGRAFAADPLIKTFELDMKAAADSQANRWNYNTGQTEYSDTMIAHAELDLHLSITNVQESGNNWIITYKISGAMWGHTGGVYNSYNGGQPYVNMIVGMNSPSPYWGNIYHTSYYSGSTGATAYYNMPSYQTMTVAKDASNPMKLIVHSQMSVSASGYSGQWNASGYVDRTYYLNLNHLPVMSDFVTSPGTSAQKYMNGTTSGKDLHLEGMVYDREGNPITLTASIYGRTKIGPYIDLKKNVSVSSPPTSRPTASNFSFDWDINAESIPEGDYSVILSALDSWNDVTTTTPMRVVVDRTKPTNNVLGASAGSIRVKAQQHVQAISDEVSSLYLVNKNGYSTKAQLDAEVSAGKGSTLAYSSPNTTVMMPAPNTSGYYKLYSVDYSDNVSQPTIDTVVVDGTSPSLVSATLNYDTIKLTYDEPLDSSAAATPASDDFFVTKNPTDAITQLLLVGNTVDYITEYADYEKDPKIDERYVYTHEKDYYDNGPAAPADFSGVPQTVPVTMFDKVGKYALSYQAGDNPPPDAPAFDSYNQLSNPVNMILLVHRKPIAEFNIGVSKSGSYYAVGLADSSYDLDHTSRADKGIVQREWKWKAEDDAKWTDGKIPSSVVNSKNYVVKLRVKDMEGAWSDEASKYIYQAVPDSLDFATVLNPAYPTGVLAGSTIGLTTTVVTTGVVSNVTATLEGESVQYQNYNGPGSTSGTYVYTQAYPVRVNKPPRDFYTMTMKVTLTSGASLTKTYKVFVTNNRPPAADFDWTPNPVWEGDNVLLRNRSTDPDGDALTYQWSIKKPDGATVLFSTRDANLVFAQPGNYAVTLTASDGKASHTVSRTVRAQPLTLSATVSHTPDWLDNHERKRHNTTSVPVDFYSGEVFVLQAVGSNAPVAETTAWLDTTGLDGGRLQLTAALSGSGAVFNGELYDERLQSPTEGLPNGVQTIHFRIRYANGVVKETGVPVNIIGLVGEYFGVHRVR